MKNKTVHNSLFHTAVCLLLMACQFQRTDLPDTKIWHGYAAIVAQVPDSRQVPHALLQEIVEEQYEIERYGPSERLAYSPQISESCLPNELRQLQTPVRGNGYYVHIFKVSGGVREEITVLEFVQWDNSSDWWVSQLTPGSPCAVVAENQ